MAEQEESKERKIPVFTVWKNNAILKNIFLINSPPSLVDDETETHHQESDENGKITHQEFEETLVVGRHPDCDIRLEHPSISRFHLRIHSKPSSKLLFLTDLSSVHGTWVSGKRIEPNIRTKLNEGDTLRIGGSSRVYKLNWIPLSQAYDMAKPFVPPLDFPEPHEDDEEEISKDENSLGLESEEVHVVNTVSEDAEPSVLCGNGDLVVEKVVPEVPVLQVEYPEIVKNQDMELVNRDLEHSVPSFLDENSEVFVKIDIPPSPSLQNEHSEVSEHELMQAMGSDVFLQNENSEVFETKGVPTINDILNEKSEVFLQKDISPASPMQNQNLGVSENENVALGCVLDVNSEVFVQNENLEELENEDMGTMDSVLEGLVPLFMGENWEWVMQENNYSVCPSQEHHPIPYEHEGIGFIDSVLEGLDSLFLDENSEMLVHKVTPSAPPMPEDMKFHFTSFLDNAAIADGARESGLAAEMIQENENQSVLQEDDVEDSSFWFGSFVAPSFPPAEEGLLFETENPNLYTQLESQLRVLSERKCIESANANVCQNSLGENHKPTELWSFWSGKMGVESVYSSLSDREAFSESENESLRSGYQSPQPLSSVKKQFGSPWITSEQKSGGSIWSRRGKQESSPQVLTSRSKGKKMRTDQENVKHEPVSRALFHGVDEQEEEEEEIFTPDKENFTPNTHKSMRKFAVLKEMKRSNSGKSSLLKMGGSPKMYSEDDMSPSSDKENHSHKTVRSASVNQVRSLRLKERRGERVPFQTLLEGSPHKSISETCIPDDVMRSGNSAIFAKGTSKTNLQDKCCGERNRKWNMVVDTTTLLNKESRKALQLLEGLKGTQLIIPRIVISELDCLKRQVSFFRRNTEVSFALEWIQDCMVKTPWWIHVQSSMEEGRPVAPTPPVSPLSQFSCGTIGSFKPFSAFEYRSELLSPTAEDHVLDYALCFKRNNNDDGQLVLLSNDVTLKIKAMAEGLICEEAEEFRESLVNPFSERFLWADSSPRGQTWSCSDDIVLREKFYPSSLKMTPKAMENVKGLKLILLHNSQYFDRMTAVR